MEKPVQENRTNWQNLILFVSIHGLAVSAIFYFTWTNIIVAFVLLWFSLGWGMLAWGVGVRTAFSWHITWAINLFAHQFGNQRFSTGENSRNNAVLGFLAFGEGWHNNHQAFPTSARHCLSSPLFIILRRYFLSCFHLEFFICL